MSESEPLQRRTTGPGKREHLIFNLVESFGYLGIVVYYNFLRDFMWTWFTFWTFDVTLSETTEVHPQFWGQWLWSTLFMAAGALVHLLAFTVTRPKGRLVRDFPLPQVAVAIFSASMAIPGWDAIQIVGMTIGTDQLGMTAANAGYFAALWTGLVEGPIQEGATTFGQIALNVDSQRARFFETPAPLLLAFAKRFAMSLTLGAVPGDVWQLVFNGCLLNSSNMFGAGLAVAVAVGISNLLYGLVMMRIFAAPLPTSPVKVVPVPRGTQPIRILKRPPSDRIRGAVQEVPVESLSQSDESGDLESPREMVRLVTPAHASTAQRAKTAGGPVHVGVRGKVTFQLSSSSLDA